MKTKITINGTPYEINGDTDTLVIIGKNIQMNGTIIGCRDLDKDIQIIIEGDPLSVSANGSIVVKGNVNGPVDANGSVDITGDKIDAGTIDARGNVKITGTVNITGDVDAGGNVEIQGNVGGNVDASGVVKVGGNVGGDIDAMGPVTVNGVKQKSW